MMARRCHGHEEVATLPEPSHLSSPRIRPDPSARAPGDGMPLVVSIGTRRGSLERISGVAAVRSA